MNILIISLFPLEYNTSVAVSSLGIIRGFLSQGHRLTIVMPEESNPTIDIGAEISSQKIIRIKGTPRNLSRIKPIGKIQNQFTILDWRTRGFLSEVNKISIPDEYYDIVLSISDPRTSHVFAKRLIRKGLKYGRWIQHWGDPITGDVSRKCRLPEWLVTCYERRLLECADKIVYVTPFTRDMIVATHASLADKIFFIPLPSEDEKEEKSILHRPLKVVYSGSYSGYIRNIKPLYDACSQLSQVELVVVGYGIPLKPGTNINIIPHTTHEKATEIENDADVIVAVCNLRGTQIPGKIFYKSSSKKHILVAIEEENRDGMYKYLESYERYTLCDNKTESIKAALTELSNKHTQYQTPSRLLPSNVAREILSI